MLSFPNCKINLGLYIVNRREDGYHDLETVFYPLALKDALEIVPAATAGRHMYITGKPVEGEVKNNLVWKAIELVKRLMPGKVPEIDIHLHKAIPMGAGLGGGSADGAFMLKLLNDYCKLGLDGAALEQMALELGSDCPFFIRNRPQLATGRGEIMAPVEIDLSGYSIQLICPQVHISTAKAFRMITPGKAPFDLRKLTELDVKDWKGRIGNDFERPVFGEFPDLKDIKDQLYGQGAVYASMSGSGSAIYGIFPKGQRAGVESPMVFEEHYME